ncbi:MAG: hypothetical protein ACE5GD_07755 [Candidatus Geothermarchaeales archaeon]
MEATEALREYFGERTQQYGGIDDDEVLYCSEGRNVPPEKRRKTSITRATLATLAKRVAKRADIKNGRDVQWKS